MARPRVLIVDDEEDMLYACRRMLKGVDVDVETEERGEGAVALLEKGRFDVMLLDLVMPGMGGMDVLRRAKKITPEVEVIMLTAYPTVETAAEAVREGAFSYVTKPFTPEQFRMALAAALAHKSLKDENLRLRAHIRRSGEKHKIIGDSRALKEHLRLLQRAAESDCQVLILGETGTGKELAAQAIHSLSDRREMPFVPLDCGALSETLLESELFGHEKGAFTGADRRRIGLLEHAAKGTVLLDEVCEMGARLQVALLRVIQEGQFRRVGGNDLLETNARILAATNRDIDQEVQRGAFRQDLFFRLNVLRVEIPPLRDRPEDIPLLADFFLERINRRVKRPVREIHPETMAGLVGYRWPGNIRELQNVMERSCLLARSEVLMPEDLPNEIRPKGGEVDPGADFQRQKRQVVEAFERDYLGTILKHTGGNVRQAARMAGMPRSSLQRLLRKHGLESSAFQGGPQDGRQATPAPPAP